jgi:ABC-type oligopeptide transport system substrate-binding subunit
MPRRLWVSLGALAVGSGLLATAQLAGAAQGSRQGGILRVGVAGVSVQIDPQLAYVTTAWWLEYATAAKLFNYPDRPEATGNRLVPEAASRYTVSRDGRTWTFTIRKGFRFSDGSPVTARSFAYAIDRVANHDLASPGAQWITDPNGTNIVGARAVNDGHATHVRGVVVRGNRLIIQLTRPDGSLLTKLTMPFFQATSKKLPLNHGVLTGYPSAGPYFFKSHQPDVVTELRRNRYYGGKRSRHLQGVEVRWNLNEQAAFEQVMANQLDEGPLPAAEVERVANRFGVNRSRFWARPVSCVGWLLFNNNRGIFKNNAPLRRAISWAVDRADYLKLAGLYSGSPWTHLLPPNFPGSITGKKLQPYAARSNIAKAKKLAAGHFRSGKVVIAYSTAGNMRDDQAQLIRGDLIRLGFGPANVTLEPWYPELGFPPPGNWNLIPSGGWCADDPDPYDFFVPFLSRSHVAPGPPLLAIDNKAYVRRIAAANKLIGNARLEAFGRLDLDISKNLAPVAPMRTYNNRFFFSARVDPRSLSYQAVYSDWSIPALALK